MVCGVCKGPAKGVERINSRNNKGDKRAYRAKSSTIKKRIMAVASAKTKASKRPSRLYIPQTEARGGVRS